MPRKDDQLNVRPSELKAALARIAKAEDRSVAYVVERILREYLEGRLGLTPAETAPRRG